MELRDGGVIRHKQFIDMYTSDVEVTRQHIYVQRNGANEGVLVTWNVPSDDHRVREGPKYTGCLHRLIKIAGAALGYPQSFLEGRDMQLLGYNGALVVATAAIWGGYRLQLLPPGQFFQWGGIELGWKEPLQDWATPASLAKQVYVQHPYISMITLSIKPKVFVIEKLMSDEECDEIIAYGNKPGVFKSATEAIGGTNTTRTSQAASAQNAEVSTSFARRAFDLLRIWNDKKIQDGFQLVRYQPGQYFKLHNDFFGHQSTEIKLAKLEERISRSVDRYTTFFVYLNNVTNGGATIFPKAAHFDRDVNQGWTPSGSADDVFPECAAEAPGLHIRPVKGQVLLFYNMLPEMVVDKLAIHGGCPAGPEMKQGANFWVWSNSRQNTKRSNKKEL